MALCNICERDAPVRENARVHCNVRAFKNETFGVWRCEGCGSIHAEEDVDLPHYYAKYPFHGDATLDWRLKVMYSGLLKRLEKGGVRREHRVLDYGCGGGHVLEFLGERGYEQVVGFDEYSEKFGDRTVLDQRYDVVLSQDVIEHVPEPWELLRRFDSLVKPGGILAIGTPNATAIDLGAAERFHHTLHQPYHRHMLSEKALLESGKKMGWELVRYYPTMYINTLFPFVNHRFVAHYFSCFDDTLDIGFEPPRVNSWKLYSPMTLFWAFFGYFFAPKTDVMAVFRKPA